MFFLEDHSGLKMKKGSSVFFVGCKVFLGVDDFGIDHDLDR